MVTLVCAYSLANRGLLLKCRRHVNLAVYLIKVVEGFVDVGEHASGRLVGDLDGRLQNTLGDIMRCGASGWFGADEEAVVFVAVG